MFWQLKLAKSFKLRSKSSKRRSERILNWLTVEVSIQRVCPANRGAYTCQVKKETLVQELPEGLAIEEVLRESTMPAMKVRNSG